MNTGEDEPSSGLNGRLRPRKSNTIAIPSPVGRSSRKTERLQDKQKRTSTPKASPNKPDDLNKSDPLPELQLLCPYCDKRFASRVSTAKHVRRSHLSSSKRDEPIGCLLCSHSEAEPNDIIRHMVDSHPNQYFACLNCHTRFPSTSDLAEHKLNFCEKQKPAYSSKLRQKSSSATRKNKKRLDGEGKNAFPNENKGYMGDHGFNGIVISCELKPSQTHDVADIEDNITTNLILPPSKALGNSGLEKNAVIVLDDIQWNKRIPSNFAFHNTDSADQILSRLGVVHRSPRVGETTRRAWFKMVDDNSHKFEKCFDTNFYTKVASNVQENIARFLDGSFNFNPDPDLNIIKTRKSKSNVVINTAEGFPILLAYEQYSRNLFDGYIPRALAPKHKWKWDSNENEDNALIDPNDIKRDNHVNNCIITLVSSLDIWTQLCMRRKFEAVFSTTSSDKTDKHNIISNELKEILESREIPTTSSQIVKYNSRPPVPTSGDKGDFPSFLGLTPAQPTCEVQPAVLSGEWVRPRCYVCCACGAQTRDSKGLTMHMSTQHPNAQVQHYEIVGEPLLNADIFKHLYVPPNQISNRTRPPRGFRDCTKCKKSVTLEDLHQHMLDCAGDTPAVRRKCRYRPFGVRRRRTRLPDNTIRKKMRKEISSRHRQKGHMRQRPKIRTEVGDAETIRKMIADLPAKRHRVVVNSSTNLLRPRRKIETQRSKLNIKRQISDDTNIRRTRSAKEAASKTSDADKKQVDSANTDEDDKPLKPSTKSDVEKSQNKEFSSDKNPLTKTRKIHHAEKRENKLRQRHSIPIKLRPMSILEHQMTMNNTPLMVNVNSGTHDSSDNNQTDNSRQNHEPPNMGTGSGDGAHGSAGNADNTNKNNDAAKENSAITHSIARITSSDRYANSTVPSCSYSVDVLATSNHQEVEQRKVFENETGVVKLHKPPLQDTGNDQSYSEGDKGNTSIICPKKLIKRKGLQDCIAMLRDKICVPSNVSDSDSVAPIDLFLPKNIDVPDVPETKNSSGSSVGESERRNAKGLDEENLLSLEQEHLLSLEQENLLSREQETIQRTIQGLEAPNDPDPPVIISHVPHLHGVSMGIDGGGLLHRTENILPSNTVFMTPEKSFIPPGTNSKRKRNDPISPAHVDFHSSHYPDHYFYKKGKRCESRIQRNSCDEPVMASHQFTKPPSRQARRNSYMESDVLSQSKAQRGKTRRSQRTESVGGNETEARNRNLKMPCADPMKYTGYYLESSLRNVRRNSYDGRIPSASDYYFPPQLASVVNPTIMPGAHNLQDPLINNHILHTDINASMTYNTSTMESDMYMEYRKQTTRRSKRDKKHFSSVDVQTGSALSARQMASNIFQRTTEELEAVLQAANNNNMSILTSLPDYSLPPGVSTARTHLEAFGVLANSDLDNSYSNASTIFQRNMPNLTIENNNTLRGTRRSSFEIHNSSIVPYANLDCLTNMLPQAPLTISPRDRRGCQDDFNKRIPKQRRKERTQSSIKSSDSSLKSTNSTVTSEIYRHASNIPDNTITKHMKTLAFGQDNYQNRALDNEYNTVINKQMHLESKESLEIRRSLVPSETQPAEEEYLRSLQYARHECQERASFALSEYINRQENDPHVKGIKETHTSTNVEDNLHSQKSFLDSIPDVCRDLQQPYSESPNKSNLMDHLDQMPMDPYMYRQKTPLPDDLIEKQKTMHITDNYPPREGFSYGQVGVPISYTHSAPASEPNLMEPLDLSGRYSACVENKSKYLPTKTYPKTGHDTYETLDLSKKPLAEREPIVDLKHNCPSEVDQVNDVTVKNNEGDGTATELSVENTQETKFDHEHYNPEPNRCTQESIDLPPDHLTINPVLCPEEKLEKREENENFNDTMDLPKECDEKPLISIDTVPQDEPMLIKDDDSSSIANEELTKNPLPTTPVPTHDDPTLPKEDDDTKSPILFESHETIANQDALIPSNSNYCLTTPLQNSIVNTTVEISVCIQDSINMSKVEHFASSPELSRGSATMTTTTNSVTGVVMTPTIETRKKLSPNIIEAHQQDIKISDETSSIMALNLTMVEPKLEMDDDRLDDLSSDELIDSDEVVISSTVLFNIVHDIPLKYRPHLIEILPRNFKKIVKRKKPPDCSAIIIPLPILKELKYRANNVAAELMRQGELNNGNFCDTTTIPNPLMTHLIGMDFEAHATVMSRLRMQSHFQDSVSEPGDFRPLLNYQEDSMDMFLSDDEDDEDDDFIIDHSTGEFKRRPLSLKGVILDNVVIDLTEDGPDIPSPASPILIPEVPKAVKTKSASEQTSELRAVRIRAPSERKSLSDLQNVTFGEKEDKLITNAQNLLILPQNIPENTVNVTSPIEEISKLNESAVLPTNLTKHENIINQQDEIKSSSLDQHQPIGVEMHKLHSDNDNLLENTSTASAAGLDDSKKITIPPVVLSTVTEEAAISTNLLLSTAHEKQDNTKNLELAQNNDIDRSKTFDTRSVSSHVIQDEISPTNALKDNNGKQDDGRTEDKTSAKLLIKIPKLDLSSGISGEALQSEDSDDDVSLAVIVRQKQHDLLTVADSNLPTTKEICSSKHKKKHKRIKQKPLKASNTENSAGHVSNKVKKALHHKIAKRTKSLVIYSENVTEMKLKKRLPKKSKNTHIEDNFNVKENNVFDHIPNQEKDTLNINPNEEDIHTNIVSNNMPTFQNPMEDVTEACDQKIKVIDTNEIRNVTAEIKENVNQIDVESEDHPLQEEINTHVIACNLDIPHNVDVHPDQLDGMSKKKRKSRTKTKNIARIESPENSSFSAEVCDTVVTLRRSSRRKSVFFDSNSQNESDIIETDNSTLEHLTPFSKKQSIFSRMVHDEVPEQDAEVVTEKERDENDVVSEKKKFRSNKRKKSPHTKRKNKKKKCHEDNTISAAMDQDKEKNEVDINESSLINDQLYSEINTQETEIITDAMSSAEKRKLTVAHKDSSRAKKSKLNEKFDVLTCEIDNQSLKVSDNTVQGELDCTIQFEDPTNTEGKKRTESGSETRSTCYNRRVENSLVKYGPTFSSKTSDNYDPYDIDFEDMIEESGPKVKPPQRKSRNNHKSSHGGKQHAVNNMQSTIKLNAQASTSPEHKDLKTQDSKSKEIENTSNNSSDSDSSKSDVPLQKYVEDKEKRRMGIQDNANEKTIKSNEENHLTLQNIDQSDQHVLETLDKLEIVPDNKIAIDEAKKDDPMKDCIELDKKVIEPQDQTPNITCEASPVILKEVVIEDSDPQQTQSGVEVVRSENGRRDKEKESLPNSQIETVAVMPTEDEQRSEKFMENFGFFSERKPRKSNLLASKKISETFHMIANDDDTYHKGKDRPSRKHSHSKSLENTPTTKISQDSASLPCNERSYIIPSTIKRDAREMEAAIELDTLSTGINVAANNMMESEEIRNLENDLIICLREAAEAKSNQSQKDKYQLEEGSLTNLPEVVIERPSPIIEQPFKDPSNECFEIVKKVPKIKIRPPGYKEKMYPDIEEIDLFEDKFDKIKRKCRSQAAAAKQTTCVIESNTGKSRKKPDKKSKKKGSNKNATILTKGAMKVFDGVKIPTHELNMPPNLSPPRIHKKRKSGSKKKRERFDSDSSRYDSKSNLKESLQEKDVYEFMDNDDTELLELRPSTVMDRFRSLSKEKTKSKDKHRDRDNKEKESSHPKIDESYEEYREAKRKPKLRPSFDERTKEDVKDKVEDIDKNEHLTDVSKVNESDEKTCLAPKQREEKEKSLDDDLFKKPSNAIRYLGRRVDTKEKYDENDGGDDAEEFDEDKDSTERSIPGPSGFVPDSNEDSSFDWSGSSDADYVYMSDGYGCSCMSDSEDSESEKGCDNNSCPYRKKNAEKNAVMGKIFKNNAVRREKNVSKPKEPAKPDLDQLFDSLLASNSNEALGQKGKGPLSSSASPSQEVFTTPPTSPEARVISSRRHDSIHTGSKYTTPTEIITPKNTRSSQNSSKDESSSEDLFASDLDCNQTNKTDCIDQYVMMSSKSIQSEDPEVVLQNAPPINSIILEQNKTDDESDTEADDFIVLKRVASMTANSTQTEEEHAEVIVSDDDDDSYMDCSVNDDLNINSPPRGGLVMMAIKSTQTHPKKHKSHKSRHDNVSPPAEVAGPSLADTPCKDFLVAKKFVTSASKIVQTDHSKLKSRKHSKHYDSGDGEGKRSKDKASRRAHRAESKNHHRSSTSDEDLKVLKHEVVLPFTVEETRREKLSSPFRLSDDGTGEDNIDSFERAVLDDAGVARQRARRKCTVGKQNVLAEHWSSESEPDGVPVRPTSADSLAAGLGRKRKGKRREGHQSSGKRASRHGKKHEGEDRVSSGSRAGTCGRSARAESGVEEGSSVSRGAPLGPKIRARPAHAHYWSSDGEEDAGAPPQHGWIVGDSHKKLVTMLANAKGRKRHNDDKRTLEE